MGPFPYIFILRRACSFLGTLINVSKLILVFIDKLHFKLLHRPTKVLSLTNIYQFRDQTWPKTTNQPIPKSQFLSPLTRPLRPKRRYKTSSQTERKAEKNSPNSNLLAEVKSVFPYARGKSNFLSLYHPCNSGITATQPMRTQNGAQGTMNGGGENIYFTY